MKRILIKDCYWLNRNQGTWEILQGNIGIEGNYIRFATSGSVQPPHDWQAEQIIDGYNKLVTPGFVNSHTHAAMALFRGFADDLTLERWLKERIWPVEKLLTPEDIYWGSKLAILEMIKNGCTAFADMYFFMDEVARAVSEAGIRASLSQGMTALKLVDGWVSLRRAKAFALNWRGEANGRISVMLGPHALYTCPPSFLAKVAEVAAELQVGVHVHVAETLAEVHSAVESYGKSPVAVLEEVGLLDLPLLAAHCVHLSGNDLNLLAAKPNIHVVHNPKSNMKLASGICPVATLLERKINVALGTDGAGSNNSLDLLEEARVAALLQKVSVGDARVLPAEQSLDLLTINGAKALGLGGEIGLIKPGYRADLVLLNIDQPHFYPRHSLVSHLIYTARGSDVDTTIVDGQVVMQGRSLTTIDEEEVFWHAQQVRKRMVDATGVY